MKGSAAKAQQNTGPPSRLNLPADRKALYDQTSQQGAVPLQRRIIPPPVGDQTTSEEDGIGGQHVNAPDMSFVDITASQFNAPEVDKTRVENGTTERARDESSKKDDDDELLSARVMKNEKLFAILSSHSDIDHPICSECTSLLLQSYTARLAAATKERDAYAGFLKQLQQSSAAHSDEEDRKLEKELSNLKKQDEETFAELLELEKEKSELEAELADLEEQSRQLDLEEQDFWSKRNATDEEMYQLNSTLVSLQEKYAHDQQQLEKLQRTNVYNDTFCIGHDGYFGTINGLRLGRLSSQNVEWAEINAAWGQTLLLLATVAERLNFTFQGYRLKPLGSTSRIERLEYPQQAPTPSQSNSSAADQRLPSRTSNPQPKVTPLDLFSSGDTAVGRVFSHRRFDAGMIAFLECLRQVGEHVERMSGADTETRPAITRQPSSKNVQQQTRLLPYPIQGDKIGQVSIKLGMGIQQDENFTKACKYALTCCKFLLAHISNLDNTKV